MPKIYCDAQPFWHARKAFTATDGEYLLVEMRAGMLQRGESPALAALRLMSQSGHDVSAALVEVRGLRQLAVMLDPRTQVTVEIQL